MKNHQKRQSEYKYSVRLGNLNLKGLLTQTVGGRNFIFVPMD
jgi:hypothetical protein